jgi:hypothetical protein
MQKKILGIALSAAGLLVCAAATDSARAEFIAYIEQVGPNVVVTGSGTLNLTGLTDDGSHTSQTGVDPGLGQLAIGPAGGAGVELYTGITGPSNFGSGGLTYANSGSGNQVDILYNYDALAVPTGYVPGNFLSDTMTFDNTTLADLLGLTSGQFTYSWGGDSFVINVDTPSPTPLPATLPLFAGGLGMLRLFSRLRKRKAAALAAV